MAIKTVCFEDDFHYDGNTKVVTGRKLVEEFHDTAAYKSARPGDTLIKKGWRGNYSDIEYKMVAATPFEATLKIVRVGANTITLLDEETNTKYPMLHSDLAAMAMRGEIKEGVVTGTFGFVKRNVKFFIEYLGTTAG